MKQSIITFLLTASLAIGQFMGSNPNSGKGIPFFRLNTYRVYQVDKAYVVVVSEILYDDLTFEFVNDQYVARYDITVFIQDEDGENNLGYITRQYQIDLDSFDNTNSRTINDRRSFEFSLKPGEYQLVAIMTDLNNGKKVKRTTETVIEDIKDEEILVSDIAFYRLDPETGERLISVDSNFDKAEKKIWAHVSITTISIEDPIEVQVDFEDKKFEKRSLKDTLFAPSKLVEFWYLVELKKAIRAQNNLKITAIQDGEEHQSERVITFYWTDVPNFQQGLETALRQMIYVAPEDSLDKYLELSEEEQIGYFQRFWRSVNPNPKSKRNELKEEYFNRINQANQAFTFFKNQGCYTDRGRIYIKFGPPDEIDRHPFDDYSYPYEVWTYHTLKKVFLFVDTNNIGEYRLDPDYYIYEFN